MAANSDMYGTSNGGFLDNSYQVNDEDSIPVYSNIQLYPCSTCGRNFNPDTLRRHQPICRKSSTKQPRKVFDTGKQRAADSDVPYTATKETTQFYHEGVKPKSDNQKTKTSNWREGHNALVRTIREARQITRAIETGAPLPKQTPSQIPSDYIQCEYCQRHFNKHSAERHIPFCETQFKRKQLQSAAISTNNTRTNSGSLGRQGRGYQQQNSYESPVGSANKQHQINSAPSTFVVRRPQKNTDEKDYRRPPINPNTFKKPTFGETSNNNINGTPPRYGSFRTTKARSATNNHGSNMRTGRTTENDDLNNTAGVGRGQQRRDPSPQVQRRVTGVNTRSPSPARRVAQNNGVPQQQQRNRTPISPTATKYCHECGESYPVDWAKFCCECGKKRLGL